MKLHVFEIDQARTHPIGHRDTVADTADLIGRMLKNLAKPAGGQNRFLRDDGVHFARGGIQHVCAVASQGGVAIRRRFSVVRKGEQIDGHPATAAGDAGS